MERRSSPSSAAQGSSWPVIAARRWATSSPSEMCKRSSKPMHFSVVGIAGTAGVAVELVHLFQVELEHYEKIEGTPLSLEGKANRLSRCWATWAWPCRAWQ